MRKIWRFQFVGIPHSPLMYISPDSSAAFFNFFLNHMLFQRLLGYYSMCTHVHVCPHLWTNMIGNGRDQLIAQNLCMYCFPHFTDKVSGRLGLLGIHQLSGRSGISNLAGHIFKYRLLLSFQSVPSVFKLTSALTGSILL